MLSRNILKIIFLIFSFNMMAVSLWAQCDESKIKLANQKFEDGNIDDLFAVLEPCLSEFLVENLEQAYRLMAMAYIAIDDLRQAEEMVIKLLKVNPKYVPNNVFDSPTFVALIEKNLKYSNNLFDTEVVSASKHKQKLSEAPAIMSIITAAQIKDYGYLTVAEAISSLPGLDMLYDYAMYNLGVRGINGGSRAGSRIVKLMIDNQPVSFRCGSENFLGVELIPIETIERIEVIRGPSSALYGANAFLGVINIITKNGAKVDGGVFSSVVGLQNSKISHAANILIGSKKKNVEFTFGGAISRLDRSGLKLSDVEDHEKFKTLDEAGRRIETKDDLSQSYSLFGKMNIDLKKAGQLSFDGNFEGLDNSAQFADWAALEQKNHIAIKNYYLRSVYGNNFSEQLSFTFSGTYSHGEPMDKEKLYTSVQIADYQTRDVGYNGIDLNTEILYSFKEKNTISFGVDFTNDKHNRQTYYRHYADFDYPKEEGTVEPTGTEYGDTTFQNLGVYVNGNIYPFPNSKIAILKSFGATLGLRYDYHNIYGNSFNFRVGNVFKPLSFMYLKLLYGTSFKAPSSTQLYTTLLVPGDVLGNADLKAEKAQTFEGAVGLVIKEKLSLEVNGFYNIVEDKVELLPYGSNLMATNSATIKSGGFESSLIYNSPLLNAYLNYSYQRSTMKHKDLYTEHDFVVYERLYPKNLVKFGFNYFLQKAGVRFGAEAIYIGERIASAENIKAYDPINFMTEDENIYELDSYVLVDVMLSCNRIQFLKGKETLLSIKISNLLNQKYYYPGYKDFDIPGMPLYTEFKLRQQF